MCYVRITSFHSHQRIVRVENPVLSFHLRRFPRHHKNEVIKINTVLLKLYIYVTVLLPITKCLRKLLITRMCTSNIKRTCELNWWKCEVGKIITPIDNSRRCWEERRFEEKTMFVEAICCHSDCSSVDSSTVPSVFGWLRSFVRISRQNPWKIIKKIHKKCGHGHTVRPRSLAKLLSIKRQPHRRIKK